MSKPVIICVDDEKTVLSSLKGQLKRALGKEYSIETAESGNDALELYEELFEDRIEMPVVISDYIMPGMKGDELLKRFHVLSPKMLKILLTGQANTKGVTNAVNYANLYRYIAKPWEQEDLILTVTEAIRSYFREKQLAEQNEKLRASEEKYRGIFENAVEGIFQSTPDGRFISANPALARIMGYDSPDELLSSVTDIAKQLYVCLEDREKIVEILRENGRVSGFETQFYGKDGSTIWASMTFRDVRDSHNNVLYYEGSIVDITARREKERAERDREAAQAANKAKSAFLASMSHEIRTPMNAVVGMTDLTLQTDLDAEQRENLQTVKDSARYLLEIINDILDFSKLEAGKVEPEYIDFDLKNALRGVMRTFSFQAGEKKLSLDLDMADDVERYVRGDPVRLRQILVNLIGNAFKFTEKGGITVTVRSGPESASGESDEESLLSDKIPLLFSVRDTGIGIPEEKQSKIFEVFGQADTSVTRKYGGTGLGLAICRQLTELMGGSIQVGSEDGKGSTFSFSVIFELGDPEKIRAEERKKERTEPAQAARSLNILVAEDNPINTKVAVKFLTRLGHSPFTAADGKEVLSVLSGGDFDLVLMDVEMPGMDGLEATRRIRDGEAGQENRRVPVIAMTAHALSEFREKCEAAGMDDFVTKPVDFYDLNTIIGKHIQIDGDDFPDSQKPGVSHTEEHLINRKEALRRFGGDESFLLEMFEVFVESTPEMIDDLQQAISGNNMEDIAIYAHSFKGTCGMIEADSCRNIATQLEQAARKEKSEQIRPLFERLEQELAKVIAEIG
ncbi:response regulator [Desulfobacterales bacterium HSG2]|nr:response regulator [Desulfobacterales bacterium HSG2]